MTILVQQLRDRALKATPGPWQHERLGIIQGGPMQTYVNGEAMPQLFTSHGADFMEPGDYLANADFVAAANPAAILSLLDELDQLKAENAELKAQAGKAMGPLTLGIRGKAYDPPGTHRAYTYAEQPDNLGAWRLGEALVEAYRAPAGDHIDGGLGLLKSLQPRGFGVFEMDRAMTKEQP